MDDRRAPVVVEFIGTPGAGKTTAAAQLVGMVQARGGSAATVTGAAREHAAGTVAGRGVARLAPQALRSPLLWQVFQATSLLHAAGFGADHAALVGHVVRSQLARPIPRALKRHILFWFWTLGGRHRFLRSTPPGGLLVFDDGFLHRSVHLFASHRHPTDAAAVRCYVDLLPRPDLVVVTRAALPVCEQRVHRRGLWAHSRHLDTAEVRRYLERAERVVDLATRRAEHRGWRVISIDTGGEEGPRLRTELERALAAVPPSAPAPAAIVGARR